MANAPYPGAINTVATLPAGGGTMNYPTWVETVASVFKNNIRYGAGLPETWDKAQYGDPTTFAGSAGVPAGVGINIVRWIQSGAWQSSPDDAAWVQSVAGAPPAPSGSDYMDSPEETAKKIAVDQWNKSYDLNLRQQEFNESKFMISLAVDSAASNSRYAASSGGSAYRGSSGGGGSSSGSMMADVMAAQQLAMEQAKIDLQRELGLGQLSVDQARAAADAAYQQAQIEVAKMQLGESTRQFDATMGYNKQRDKQGMLLDLFRAFNDRGKTTAELMANPADSLAEEYYLSKGFQPKGTPVDAFSGQRLEGQTTTLGDVQTLNAQNAADFTENNSWAQLGTQLGLEGAPPPPTPANTPAPAAAPAPAAEVIPGHAEGTWDRLDAAPPPPSAVNNRPFATNKPAGTRPWQATQPTQAATGTGPQADPTARPLVAATRPAQTKPAPTLGFMRDRVAMVGEGTGQRPAATSEAIINPTGAPLAVIPKKDLPPMTRAGTGMWRVSGDPVMESPPITGPKVLPNDLVDARNSLLAAPLKQRPNWQRMRNSRWRGRDGSIPIPEMQNWGQRMMRGWGEGTVIPGYATSSYQSSMSDADKQQIADYYAKEAELQAMRDSGNWNPYAAEMIGGNGSAYVTNNASMYNGLTMEDAYAKSLQAESTWAPEVTQIGTTADTPGLWKPDPRGPSYPWIPRTTQQFNTQAEAGILTEAELSQGKTQSVNPRYPGYVPPKGTPTAAPATEGAGSFWGTKALTPGENTFKSPIAVPQSDLADPTAVRILDATTGQYRPLNPGENIPVGATVRVFNSNPIAGSGGLGQTISTDTTTGGTQTSTTQPAQSIGPADEYGYKKVFTGQTITNPKYPEASITVMPGDYLDAKGNVIRWDVNQKRYIQVPWAMPPGKGAIVTRDQWLALPDNIKQDILTGKETPYIVTADVLSNVAAGYATDADRNATKITKAQFDALSPVDQYDYITGAQKEDGTWLGGQAPSFFTPGSEMVRAAANVGGATGMNRIATNKPGPNLPNNYDSYINEEYFNTVLGPANEARNQSQYQAALDAETARFEAFAKGMSPELLAGIPIGAEEILPPAGTTAGYRVFKLPGGTYMTLKSGGERGRDFASPAPDYLTAFWENWTPSGRIVEAPKTDDAGNPVTPETPAPGTPGSTPPPVGDPTRAQLETEYKAYILAHPGMATDRMGGTTPIPPIDFNTWYSTIKMAPVQPAPQPGPGRTDTPVTPTPTTPAPTPDNTQPTPAPGNTIVQTPDGPMEIDPNTEFGQLMNLLFGPGGIYTLSYDSNVYEQAPGLEFLSGGSFEDYASLTNAPSEITLPSGEKVTLPSPGDLSVEKLLWMRNNSPSQYAMYKGWWAQANRNLDNELSRLLERAPLGNAQKATMIAT